MMDIIINGRVFSVEQPSGAGQAGISLIRALQNMEVSLTVYAHEEATPRFEGIDVNDTYFPVNSQLYGLFWEQLVLPNIINQSSGDIYFCPTMNSPLREVDIPTVVQIHDIFRYIGDVSRFDKLRQQIRLPQMLSCADSIVTVSEFSKSEIIKYLDVSPSKIEVIYNGVDPIFLDNSRSESIDLPNKYILYVGGTNARKNISSLLDCYKNLKNEYNIDHDLVMVGPDPKLHHNYPVDEINGENIHITGYISKRELKFVYEHAEVFLFPSLYEGFGMAPVEAMACGTPVVASNKASLPEILGDGAILVDPTDTDLLVSSVQQLLCSPDSQKELIRKGKSRAAMFTWQKSAQALIDIMYDLC